MRVKSDLRIIHQIVLKEILQLVRDPVRLRMMIFAPVMQLILLGFAANLDTKNMPLVVQDNDHTVASRELVDRFQSSGYFVLRGRTNDPREADAMLNQGGAALVLVIPHGFARNIAARRPAPVQAIADGSDAAFASRSVSYAALIVSQYSRDILIERMDRSGQRFEPVGVAARVRVWFNPELDSRWFLIPGVLALVLMVLTMVGTSMNVVREKEIGTLEQLIVTPIRPYQLILGKLIPNAIVGGVVSTLVVLLVVTVFRIPIRGNLFLLFALTLLFLLSMQGLGLFVSTVSRTQQQAMLSGIFFILLPMMLLSGFVFPIDNMPQWIQLITYLIPLRYFFVIMRGLFLKGVGLEVLWDESLALLAFTILILTLSISRFQKRLG